MSLKGNGAKKDWAATDAAKKSKRLRCKNSFIATDGREFLSSGDWSRRRKECFERDFGCCVVIVRGTDFCGQEAVHAHHQKHRVDGGDDSLDNLVSVCAFHHKMLHPEKQVRLRSIPNVHPNEA